MTVEISEQLLADIRAHGEAAYPEEGAGLLLGEVERAHRRVMALVKLPNRREDSARHNRYALGPEDYLQGEQEAARLGLGLVGIFHSHPDHPDLPSEFDREWAWPTFAYLITSVRNGRATGSRAWRLKEDRSGFLEEFILIMSKDPAPGLDRLASREPIQTRRGA